MKKIILALIASISLLSSSVYAQPEINQTSNVNQKELVKKPVKIVKTKHVKNKEEKKETLVAQKAQSIHKHNHKPKYHKSKHITKKAVK